MASIAVLCRTSSFLSIHSCEYPRRSFEPLRSCPDSRPFCTSKFQFSSHEFRESLTVVFFFHNKNTPTPLPSPPVPSHCIISWLLSRGNFLLFGRKVHLKSPSVLTVLKQEVTGLSPGTRPRSASPVQCIEIEVGQ